MAGKDRVVVNIRAKKDLRVGACINSNELYKYKRFDGNDEVEECINYNK
jgi:hypothetical protein